MPIVPPLLDDRTWKELRDEALARVPVYTPEWTDHQRPGDPGVALVEVFAYLTEALIYRLNRVPDNSYLAFLNLLDAPPRPGVPSHGLVQLGINAASVGTALIPPEARLSAGKVKFATTTSLTVLPVEVAGFIKCRTQEPRAKSDGSAYAQSAFKAFTKAEAARLLAKGDPNASETLDQFTPVHFTTRAYPPPDGSAMPLTRAIDGALWVAVLMREKDYQSSKASPAELAAKKEALRKSISGKILSVGLAPASLPGRTCTHCERPEDGGGNRAVDAKLAARWRWHISAPVGSATAPLALLKDQQPGYAHVTVVDDTTNGLRHPGVVKLQLPAYNPPVAGKRNTRPEEQLATWEVVETPPDGAGKTRLVPLGSYPRAGDLPPFLDDGELEKRVLFWLRAIPREASEDMAPTRRPRESRALRWLGANAAEVVQALRQNNEFLGVGTGQPSQQLALAFKPVIEGSLRLSVNEGGSVTAWTEVPGFDAASERDSVFVLDRALGLITVGDGLKGRVLPDGAQVVATYQYGGGLSGNLPPGSINRLDTPVDPSSTAELDSGKTLNPVATEGGSETETVDQARRRVPMILRHQYRAVTADDFRELAALTPGMAVGRTEVLPLYRPGSPADVKFPGVVTVLVVPSEDPLHPRAPEPDLSFRQAVCRHLDRHRLLTTELYVIGPRYVRLAVSVGVRPKPGTGMEALNNFICLALHQYFAPLAPFGPDGAGWPLGGRINRAAIEAAVLQVEGVAWVEELRLHRLYGDGTMSDNQEVVNLGIIDLPELVQVDVGLGAAPPITPPPATTDKVPVPVPVPRTSC
jgi:hypothetical protein